MPKQIVVNPLAEDIQESLKILQFRFGRRVGFRPAVVRRGVRYYLIEGQLHAEHQIVSWTEAAAAVIASGRPSSKVPN